MKLPLDKVVYSTPPSPVVLVSTLNKQGRKNLAPFGFFMTCAHKPPMLAIGVRKSIHTYKYAKQTGEFVVGIPTPEIVRQLYKAGQRMETDDEFKESDLTPIPSEKVKPFRIKECQVNLECKLVKELEVGDHIIIIGEVIAADIKDELYDEDKAKLRYNLNSLYHITGPNFITKDGKKIKVE